MEQHLLCQETAQQQASVVRQATYWGGRKKPMRTIGVNYKQVLAPEGVPGSAADMFLVVPSVRVKPDTSGTCTSSMCGAMCLLAYLIAHPTKRCYCRQMTVCQYVICQA